MSDRPRPPLVELTHARLREFLREPEAVFWVFAFPVLMALALGIAFRSERTQESLVGVLRGPGAAEAVRQLSQEKGVNARELSPEEAEPALRNGDVSLVVVPGPPPTYRFDPTRPESRMARLLADAALQRAAGRADAWPPREETVTTPGSRYIDWLLPGLLGMNIMGTGLWSVGFSVVVARTRKLLKRLMATPMSRGAYLASHLLARLVFLFLEVAALLAFGRLVFGVRSAGPLWAVAGLCLLGALAFSGLGLLVASRARTIEAVSGLMNVVMLPMWLLSGVFFSSAHFPQVAQPFIKALPLTALNDALRAVMLEGRGLGGVGAETGILAAWGLVAFLLAVRIFRWR
jgi:ABC-type multidrug transport system permease subunit